MKIKHTFFRSKGRLINETDDMVRLTIDLPRIEGMKLKSLLEKSPNSEARCNQPKPSLCEKRKAVVFCTHDEVCTFKQFDL